MRARSRAGGGVRGCAAEGPYWAQTPAEERAGLFEIDKQAARQRLGDACAHAPGLVEAFGTFALLIRAPGLIEARQIAEACHQTRERAEEQPVLAAAMLSRGIGPVGESRNSGTPSAGGGTASRQSH